MLSSRPWSSRSPNSVPVANSSAWVGRTGGFVLNCVSIVVTVELYSLMNDCSWASTCLALTLGGCTSSVTGPCGVRPVSVSVIPAIAFVTVFELDVWVTPSTANSASTPSLAVPATSLRAAPVTLMNSPSVAPVARLDSTSVSPSSTAA